MNRLKSLDPPHKGLRNAISKLVFIAGKTNFTSVDSVRLLKDIATEVFHLLKDHSRTEDKFILAPLEKRNPGFTNSYFSDHAEIDLLEKELIERITSLDGNQSNDFGHELYLDLCNFQAKYLMHINEEDFLLEMEMQKHFSDEELIQHQLEIMSEMSFETLLLWFKYIVPSRRPEENAQVLRNFKSVAPSEAYYAVLNIIKPEIPENEFQLIDSLVNEN